MEHHPILIAEDNEDTMKIMTKAFKRIKKQDQVRFFPSGVSLLHYLNTLPAEQSPGLIVLDYFMPEMDASQTLTRIRYHAHHSQVPVVIYSEAEGQDIRNRLQGLEVLAVIQKAPNFSKLVEQVSFFVELIADDTDMLLGVQ